MGCSKSKNAERKIVVRGSNAKRPASASGPGRLTSDSVALNAVAAQEADGRDPLDTNIHMHMRMQMAMTAIPHSLEFGMKEVSRRGCGGVKKFQQGQ